MQDNYTYDDVIEQLVRYMDGELNADENAAVEKLLLQDAALKERFENLLAAKAAIRSKGLQQRVMALHQQYYATIRTDENNETQTAKIIKPSFGNTLKFVLRIAAVFIFIVAGYTVYQYSTTSNANVFADNFINYQLPVSRGENKETKIDSLYQSANYNALLQAFESSKDKTQKDYFLAALAYLETGNSNASINTFKNLQQINSAATEKYFVQETEYYLALAYIKAGNIDEAEKQLSTIKANKQHLFYQKANEISSTKLRILKMKN